MSLYITKIKEHLFKNKISVEAAAKSMGLTAGGFHQAARKNTFKVRDIEALCLYLQIPFCQLFSPVDFTNNKLMSSDNIRDMIEREKFYQNIISQLTETNKQLVGKVIKLEGENESLRQRGA